MNKSSYFKILFSFTFIVIASLMLFVDWFRERADNRFIALIIIAFIPWVIKYLKSVEAFGIKADLVTREQKNKIDESEQIIKEKYKTKSQKKDSNMEIIFSLDETNNINIKLTLIRYDIERILRLLCKQNGIEEKRMNIPYMIYMLREKSIINNQVANLLIDVMPILNKGVHSDLNGWVYSDAEWVIEKGKFILDYLNSLQNNRNKTKKINA